ncbi:tyrosine-type recombinase/integrase [Cupriavidus sp.]|uniref:tyrosine-type recombinase/integrase n=1 Tax=Cupriavidus sp. TaxID=1873897 RepID=UPI0028BF21A6|nr:tyrosine-type recombinase/integrase [Cupriavidus sp.]
MLTDTKCRTAPAKARQYKLNDGKGLNLKVESNGRKVWVYRFELQGTEGTYTIGEYATAPAGESKAAAEERRAGGRYTLAEARDERVRCRGLVKQGINPVHHRKHQVIQREHSARITFDLVAREWIERRDWKEITKKRRIRLLERLVFPKIGNLPMRQITSLLVLDVLNTANKDNGPTVRDEIKRTISSVFDHAIATLRADADPAHPVRKAFPRNKTQHKPALDDKQLGQLLHDFSSHGGRYETISSFRLMWLTLCRPNEICEARWEEFDLNAAAWHIPGSRMKGKEYHRVPLSKQAVELLRAMQPLTGKYEHVFPGRDDKRKPMTQASWRQALKKLGWSGKFSPHATRTTGSTRLNELDYPGMWVESQLAHKDPNRVARSYNRATHYTAREEMMSEWADRLDKLQAQAAEAEKAKAETVIS